MARYQAASVQVGLHGLDGSSEYDTPHFDSRLAADDQQAAAADDIPDDDDPWAEPQADVDQVHPAHTKPILGLPPAKKPRNLALSSARPSTTRFLNATAVRTNGQPGLTHKVYALIPASSSLLGCGSFGRVFVKL